MKLSGLNFFTWKLIIDLQFTIALIYILALDFPENLILAIIRENVILKHSKYEINN